MKTLIITLITLISLTTLGQKVDKIIQIEQADTILYVICSYQDSGSVKFREYLPINEFAENIENLETALKTDEYIINDMDKVTRTLYQNILVSLTGFDRLTLNEPNNNNTYKLMELSQNTLIQVGTFEQAIRNYLNQ